MGIGIDCEDSSALARLDPAVLHRFVGRWFTAAERLWCVAQPDLARAVVVGVCCKEAVYKAVGGRYFSPELVEVELVAEGHFSIGEVRGIGQGSHASLVWTRAGSSVLAIAVSSEVDSGVLHRLAQLVPLKWKSSSLHAIQAVGFGRPG